MKTVALFVKFFHGHFVQGAFGGRTRIWERWPCRPRWWRITCTVGRIPCICADCWGRFAGLRCRGIPRRMEVALTVGTAVLSEKATSSAVTGCRYPKWLLPAFPWLPVVYRRARFPVRACLSPVWSPVHFFQVHTDGRIGNVTQMIVLLWSFTVMALRPGGSGVIRTFNEKSATGLAAYRRFELPHDTNCKATATNGRARKTRANECMVQIFVRHSVKPIQRKQKDNSPNLCGRVFACRAIRN